mmetsp:Transcript_92390/g.258169  ORF Transcript_92390/g.258169 Transcript_92390/m.258169 type:complete len:311 (-) Transcript_92390:770-1702(-)
MGSREVVLRQQVEKLPVLDAPRARTAGDLPRVHHRRERAEAPLQAVGQSARGAEHGLGSGRRGRLRRPRRRGPERQRRRPARAGPDVAAGAGVYDRRPAARRRRHRGPRRQLARRRSPLRAVAAERHRALCRRRLRADLRGGAVRRPGLDGRVCSDDGNLRRAHSHDPRGQTLHLHREPILFDGLPIDLPRVLQREHARGRAVQRGHEPSGRGAVGPHQARWAEQRAVLRGRCNPFGHRTGLVLPEPPRGLLLRAGRGKLLDRDRSEEQLEGLLLVLLHRQRRPGAQEFGRPRRWLLWYLPAHEDDRGRR